jgi:DNA-binding transcriptional regulator YhcF (GntR family)
MDYRKIYMLIINKAKLENRKKKNGIYFELHHILPKSLFPLWKFKKANKVLLTAREHFFCHQLLTKIFPGSEMLLAIWRMANCGNYKITSKEYEDLKKQYAEINSKRHKGKKDTDETKQKKKIATKLKFEEHPELMEEFLENGKSTRFQKGSLVNLGRKHSEERKENNRQKHLGRYKGSSFWTNGVENRMCFASPGTDWVKGRTRKKND